jgi:hypothetical protein
MISMAIAAALIAGTLHLDDRYFVSARSLMSELISRSNAASWPLLEYTCRQASSYDRASKSAADQTTWLANGDQGQYDRVITRESGKSEFVMLDATGPGAVVRIWSANPKGTLRIYIDGAEKPAVEASMQALLGGKGEVPPPLAQERSRGYTLLAPIPYKTQCVITSDEKEIYYQINYRTYGDDARLVPFESFAEDALVFKSMERTLTQVPPAANTPLLTARTLVPGQTHSHSLPTGPSAIEHLAIKLAAADLDQALRSTIVRMSFDGEATVWCPVGELVGMGPRLRPFATWWTAADADGTLHLYFPMPYAQRAVISFDNLGQQPVQVDMSARIMPRPFDERSMLFHAHWRGEYPINTRPMIDWNYVAVKGRGIYLGDSLSVMNPVADWWGEGDEKIYIDGESFPSHFGTGTEDYYGYAWCSPQTFIAAFNAQPRCDGEAAGNNLGRTTVMRTRGLDLIPFKTSLQFDMEVWHWKQCEVEYAATTWFYAMPGATVEPQPDANAAARLLVQAPPPPPPRIVPGAIELETIVPTAMSEGTASEAQGGFGPDLWSGAKHLWVRARKVGDFVELKVPAQDGQPRELFLHATRSWDYGTVQVRVNGTKAGEPIDLCSMKHEVMATPAISLGTHAPVEGAYVLRFELTGTNAAAEKPGTYFGLDCIVIK